MNSFAFWYEKQDNSQEELQAEVHFNLFCEYDKKGKPILDVGFLIENISLAKKLFFFIPAEEGEGEDHSVIEDLGTKLEEGKVLNAVFNELYSIQKYPDQKYYSVENRYNSDDRFIVYCLDIKNDLNKQSFSQENGDTSVVKGTIISIKTDKLIVASEQCKHRCYIRFRIRNNSLEFLVREYHLPFSALQSVFQTTHMVDFRYNNTRSLPSTLVEQMRNNNCGIVKVSSLHFLLITKAHVVVSGGSFLRARAIEPDVWKPYLSNAIKEKDTRDMVAYHYLDRNVTGAEEKNGMFPSDFFVKYQVEKSVALLYIVLTILMGALGSGVATLLFG